MQTTNQGHGFRKLQVRTHSRGFAEKFSQCVNFGSQAADYSDAKKTFDIAFWQAYLPSVAITTSCVCLQRETQGLGLTG
jgi:hypothetical protein